jgi:hypothetical protein
MYIGLQGQAEHTRRERILHHFLDNLGRTFCTSRWHAELQFVMHL